MHDHERDGDGNGDGDFLNGVCRHEHQVLTRFGVSTFLNGVCRHEPERDDMLLWFIVSKWRMSP